MLCSQVNDGRGSRFCTHTRVTGSRCVGGSGRREGSIQGDPLPCSPPVETQGRRGRGRPGSSYLGDCAPGPGPHARAALGLGVKPPRAEGFGRGGERRGDQVHPGSASVLLSDPIGAVRPRPRRSGSATPPCPSPDWALRSEQAVSPAFGNVSGHVPLEQAKR